MNNGMFKSALPTYQRGLSIIELMVAMLLGLVIMGAVAGVMLSNTQSFRTARAVSQIQDSVRVGYELLARDIRQAGNMPCGNDVQVVNILNDAQGADTPWQYDWGDGILGLDADDVLSGVNNRVAGTEALILTSGDAGDVYIEDYAHDNNSANFTVGFSGESHGLRDGDILMVCNEKLATIFQMSSGQGNNAGKIIVNTGNDVPGNCTKGLGEIIPGNNPNQPCNINGVRGPYGPNTIVAKLSSVAWYIGDNGRAGEGGRSLYMVRLGTASNGNAELNQIEVASGVTDMQLRYRLKDTSNFIAAGSVTNWADVNAVEVSLKLDSQDRNVSVDRSENNGRLSREFTSIVAIRNRSL